MTNADENFDNCCGSINLVLKEFVGIGENLGRRYKGYH